LLAIAAVLAAGALPSAAAATTVELHDGLLAIQDADGVANDLDVRQLSLVEYEVFDEAGSLVPGVGCGALSDALVRCAGQALSVRVDAGAGDDFVGLWDIRVPVRADGGDGDDALAGGAASDQLSGGAGDDSLSGAAGDDRLSGEVGGDFAEGVGGADTLVGGDGDDILAGGGGSGDVVTGGDGRDLAYGGAGDDQIDGGGGDDALVGGKGRDDIGTGLGHDDVFGGGGRVNSIDCRQGDRARGQAGALPPGCAPMPASEALPDAWPPEDQPAATAAQVVYQVFAKPKRKGDARRYWVVLAAGESVHREGRVKVKFRLGGNVLARRCLNHLWTNTKTWRKVPKKARAATKVTGKVRVGGHC
jgi:Ca2+-binding RTX toxin-like protein